MIQTRVTFTRLQINESRLGLDRRQLRELGDVALDSIKGRVARGVGVDDAPMPPLQTGYARAKQRRGLRSIRDLRFTGAMLDNLTVRSSTDDQVTIALTSEPERVKGFRNQLIAEWLGLSSSDERTVLRAAFGFIRRNIGNLFSRAA